MVLWQQRGDGAPERHSCTTPFLLGLARTTGGGEGGAVAPVVVPARPGSTARRAAVGVLVVPPAWGRRITRDRLRLPAGLYLLAHGMCLELDDLQVWVSAAGQPVTTTYDGVANGADAFCPRTKARLESGEPVVRCPGTPDRDCGLLYRETAWDPTLTCRHCGYDPQAPEWRPPARQERSRLDALIELARASR